MQDTIKGLKLRNKAPVICFGMSLGSVRIAEMISHTSFDIIMVDLLHSHFTKDTATGAIRSLSRSGGPIPFGRVANNNAGEINELLDAGALGVIVPMIESKEEVAIAVEAAYYPPKGKRSKGSPAAIFYGNEYYTSINQELNLIVMIETPEAALKVDEILSVPGVTGCLIGAGDLSFIMKERNILSKFSEVVNNIIVAGQVHDVPIGISVNSPVDLEKWWYCGIDFFLVSHDMVVMNMGLKSHEKKYTNLVLGERNNAIKLL
jgi:4-hydroxy-2-oxoheptanedioate aldolase